MIDIDKILGKRIRLIEGSIYELAVKEAMRDLANIVIDKCAEEAKTKITNRNASYIDKDSILGIKKMIK